MADRDHLRLMRAERRYQGMLGHCGFLRRADQFDAPASTPTGCSASALRPNVSGTRSASVARKLTTLKAMMYQIQDSLSPVALMIQVNTICAVPPKIVTPS